MSPGMYFVLRHLATTHQITLVIGQVKKVINIFILRTEAAARVTLSLSFDHIIFSKESIIFKEPHKNFNLQGNNFSLKS
jgi:hypothetical protein